MPELERTTRLGGQALGRRTLAAHELLHGIHRGGAQAKLRLVQRGQRHPEMLADEGIAKPDYRDVLRNPKSLLEHCFGTSNGDKVVDRLHGGGVGSFVNQLAGGLGSVLDGAPRLEYEFLVHVQPRLPQGAAVTLEPFLRSRAPWAGR